MAKLKCPGRSILLVFALGATLLGGCGSDGDSNAAGNSQVPTVTSLSPSSADAGGSTFLLTVNGTNFVAGSSVRWGATVLPTTFVSSTQLTTNVDGSHLASSGFAQVIVSAPNTSTSSGGISAPVSFNILAITPVIDSLSPSSSTAGSAPIILTVDGSKFVAGSTIRWNGVDRPTTFVSSTKLTAAISSADVAAASASQVTVRNPPAIGGTSTAATFTIMPAVPSPVPTIASLLPASLAADVTGLALTVTGTGFVAASVGQWNGSNRATIVKSSTQLLLAPLPGDLAAPGTALITVSSPAPGGGMSGSLVASISALPAGAVGVTDRLSVAGDFAEAMGNSYGVGAISADGRFIAFSSEAVSLVPGDTNGTSDVFVRDTCRGATGCIPSINRVSVASDGIQGVGTSTAPAISADGRFVSFASSAANLVPGDTNTKSDIFVRDTCAGATGCVPSTRLVSANDGGVAGTDDSGNPAISADGRFVSFESRSENLVSGDTNNSTDIFLRDTCVGSSSCTPSTIRVSVSGDGSQAAGIGSEVAMSADGRFVAFTSTAATLVASDTNNSTDIFVRDTCAGAASCVPSTTRVSLDSAGEEANASSFLPGISADGRFIVFTSWASDMVAGDTNGGHDVFVRDTCRGVAAVCTPSNRRVSVGTNGEQANANSGGPATGGASISGNGRFVAFGSRATNLVDGDSIGQFEIFLHDTCAGATACVPSTKRLSAALDGTQSTETERSDAPVISSDGRFVAFTSNSAAFLPGDTNQTYDVFLARTGAP